MRETHVASALGSMLLLAASLAPAQALAHSGPAREPAGAVVPLAFPAGTTERVSVGAGGAQANGASEVGAMSADGRFVAFLSVATNLASPCTSGVSQVFVRDRAAGTTTCASLASDGTPGNGTSSLPALSADGRFVAFDSFATNLASPCTTGGRHVFVLDRVVGTTCESVSAGTPGNGTSSLPALSADGRFVAFESFATNLASPCTTGVRQVFVRDRVAGTMTCASLASDGTPGNGTSSLPALSADGRFVTFESTATNLASPCTTGVQVFVRDRVAGTMTCASLASDGTPGNGSSAGAGISDDGRFVAFTSEANNLVPGDTNGQQDAFVRDRTTGATRRVSVSGAGDQGNLPGSFFSMSGGGRFVVFSSGATNLVPGDVNGFFDVFIHDLNTGKTELVSLSSAGAQGTGGTSSQPRPSHRAVSGDGRFVAFTSFATNLVASDTNGIDDAFVRDRLVADVTPPNTAPSISAGGPYSVPEGGSVAVLASGTDPEGQALSYEWDLDDNGTFEMPGQSVTFSAAGLDGPGSRTIRARATDSGGLSATATASVSVQNVAPTATFNAPASVDEGSAIALSLTGAADPSAADTAAGFHYGFACDGGSLAGATYAGSGASASQSCTFDDGPSTRTVRARAIDKDGGFSEYTTVVEVRNVAPSVTAAADQSADEGASVAFELGSFEDPGVNDRWIVVEDPGDGDPFLVLTVPATSFTFPDTPHTYDDNGSYTVTVTVTDKDGASDTGAFLVAVANVAPTASFNAPSTLDEGSAIALSLTGAADPSSADTAAGFTYAFDCGDGSGFGPFAPANSASCPTIDNGTRTVRGQIRDKDGGVSEYQASVSVLNVAPALTPAVGQGADEGASVSFALGSFADPGADAPWQVTVTWGDISAPESFSRSSTGLLPQRAHTYDDNGTYTVTVTVTDSDNAADTGTFQVTVANVPPSATFNAQTPVDEGSSFELSLTNPSDPSNADTTAGFTYAFDCGDGGGPGPFGPSNTRTCPTSDNGSPSVAGKIRDKDGGTREYTATVQVNNVAPTCGPIVAPLVPVAVGTPVTSTAPFTDPGTADTHTAVMNWGDGTSSAGTVTEAGGSGDVTATHTYSAAGVFALTLTVTDDDLGSGQCTFQFVVVFNPEDGFVTGGGWINSPPGAFTDAPTLTGKATFGFVAKYLQGSSTPTGNTEFQFKAGNLNFKSSSYDFGSLVVAGSRALYKGSATINGTGDFAFRVTAIDGDQPGGGGVDKFHIKIWNKTTGGVIYDNQVGAGDFDDPTTALGGGSITIHK